MTCVWVTLGRLSSSSFVSGADDLLKSGEVTTFLFEEHETINKHKNIMTNWNFILSLKIL